MGMFDELEKLSAQSTPPPTRVGAPDVAAEPVAHPKLAPLPAPPVVPAEARKPERQKVRSSINKPDSVQAGYHASTPTSSPPLEQIERIRKIVKGIGKEVSFIRMTTDEKRQLSEIVFSHRQQGIRLSENEVNRIAVNFMLDDYKLNGKTSMLARVIAALLA